MDQLPIIIPLSFLVAALLATLAGLWRPVAGYVVAVLGSAAGLALALVGLLTVLRHGTLTHELGGWAPPVGIEYVLDPLAAFVAAIVALVGLAVVIYPSEMGFFRTVRPHSPWLYGVTLLLLAGILGVVASGDLFNLFVFLEVYSVATYALVSLGGGKAHVASFRYLILGSVGAGFYLLGVGFIYFSTGSLNMADVGQLLVPLHGEPQVIAGAVLIVVGLAVKMALFPFHVWLPDAHSYAPPGVAALLAAVQVKAAAYALVRMLLTVFGVDLLVEQIPVAETLAWFSAAGIAFGSVMAFRQHDVKRMLAYSTVAQLGFIGLGIGLATSLGIVGALLHVLNHALMKCGLFLAAGAILYRTGFTDVRRFGGLGRQMPLTAAAFTVSALAMIGIPPTAGFFSKWYLVLASFEAGRGIFAAVIIGGSLLSAVYFFRVIERLYVHPASESQVESATEIGPTALGPMLTLAAGVLVFGLLNVSIVTEVLERVVTG